MGNIIRAITSDGSITVCAIDSTQIAAKAEHYHRTSAVVTAALGRLLTAASLMGCQMKNEKSSITLKINGGGPADSIIAVSDFGGNVKGYAVNPIVEIPLNAKGKLDVSGAVGSDGILYVMRDFGTGEPYIGQSKLVSGEIAEDITNYYAQSEQIPTVCALGVLVDTDLTVKKAGGFLLQLLPGATDAVIEQIEENIKNLKPVTEMLSDGMTTQQICQKMLNGFEMEILDTFDAVYKCDCSRDRVEKALSSLSRDELLSLPDEKGHARVECHFCNKIHRFNKQELRAIADNQ